MRRLLLVAVLSFTMSAFGQTFRVSVALPSDTAAGRATLTILDGTQRRPQYSARVRQGQCTFEGRLMAHQPYWAELRHPSLREPLGFFLEPGRIAIEGHRVIGSESHSQWASLQEGDPVDFARQNPDHLLSPTLLFQSGLPYAELQPLADSLRGDALRSSHLQPLRQLLLQLAHSSEGARLPDSLLRQGATTLLLFTAPWCEPCQRAADSLAAYQPLLLDVEQDPTLWDRFALPHIPFLILASPQGVILHRDLRWWEVLKLEIETNPRHQRP